MFKTLINFTVENVVEATAYEREKFNLRSSIGDRFKREKYKLEN